MYEIEIRRTALKDLKDIPADYVRLITRHIDLLEQNPRPTDSKKLKGNAGFSLRIGTYRVLKLKWLQFIASSIAVKRIDSSASSPFLSLWACARRIYCIMNFAPSYV